jgi:hypothetical protein
MFCSLLREHRLECGRLEPEWNRSVPYSVRTSLSGVFVADVTEVDRVATRAIHRCALQARREVGRGNAFGDNPSALTAFEVWLYSINASDELALKVWSRDDNTAGIRLRLGNDLEP